MRAAARDRRPHADRAARLPRVQRAALPGARGADRLRRRPEGGLPCRRAVRDAASQHRVGRDRRAAAGTRSSTSTPTRALAALERRPPAERPPLYGDGHAAERCARRSTSSLCGSPEAPSGQRRAGLPAPTEARRRGRASRGAQAPASQTRRHAGDGGQSGARGPIYARRRAARTRRAVCCSARAASR